MPTKTKAVSARLVDLTPALAKKILEEKNVRNRPIRDSHVDTLVQAMTEGSWRLNGDTISIGKTTLIDGQHRLWAVVMSGVTVPALIVEGLDDDVFDTKDVGRRRTAADTLAVRGEKNTARMAATLVLIEKYMTGRVSSSMHFANTEVAAMVDKYPGVRDSIRHEFSSKGLLPASLADACYYLFSQVDRELADDFFKRLHSGIDLHEGDPVYALRERLLHNSLSKAKFSKPYLFAICIKAWNAARTGSKIRVLGWRSGGDSPEPFPVIR